MASYDSTIARMVQQGLVAGFQRVFLFSLPLSAISSVNLEWQKRGQQNGFSIVEEEVVVASAFRELG